MTDEQFIQDVEIDARNHEYAGMSAFAAGMRHVLVMSKARRPGSIPVVDAARAAEAAVPQQGFYDDEYFVVTPGAAPSLQNGRVA